VISAVNGHKISRGQDLSELISRSRPGDVVTLEVVRDGKTRSVRVTLGSRPASLPK
jgi:S1-C subfamily serine protease